MRMYGSFRRRSARARSLNFIRTTHNGLVVNKRRTTHGLLHAKYLCNHISFFWTPSHRELQESPGTANSICCVHMRSYQTLCGYRFAPIKPRMWTPLPELWSGALECLAENLIACKNNSSEERKENRCTSSRKQLDAKLDFDGYWHELRYVYRSI